MATAMDDVSLVTSRGQKGKTASRASWDELPQDLIKSIADSVVWTVWYGVLNHMPASWKAPQFHSQQRTLAMLHIARALGNMHGVCTKWQAALEEHWYWNGAHDQLDPHNQDIQYYVVTQAVQQRLDNGAFRSVPVQRAHHAPANHTYTNYCRTLSRTCLPCRLRQPGSSYGVNANGVLFHSRHFGDFPLCQSHHPDRICGICLKDEVLDMYRVSEHRVYTTTDQTIYPSDDDPAFADVRSTCRACRSQILQQRLPRMNVHQWPLIEPIVEPYLEFSDGHLKDILMEVDEKLWLVSNTNYREMQENVVAQERLLLKQEVRAEREAEGVSGRRAAANEARLQQLLDSGNASPEAIEQALAMQAAANEEDDEELIDDDVSELLNQQEESDVTDIALTYWSRQRILEGCWISPLDIHHRAAGTRTRAEILHRAPPAWHPVRSLSEQPVDTSEQPSNAARPPASQNMPRIGTIRCEPPPGRIAQRAQWHFENNMRLVLLPALENLAARLTYEADLDGKDVCALANTFTPPMLLEELTAVQLWGDKYDWANASTSPTITSTATIESGSDRDSPPSTIRTTPSPTPPAGTPPKSAPGVFATAQAQDARFNSPPSPTTLAMPTSLLPHVPYIPRASEHVGPNAVAILESIWREATQHLFACQCGICLRAAGRTIAIENARRRAKEEEEAKAAEQRQTAPPPSPNLPSVDNEVDDENGLQPVRRTSSPTQASTPLRRSRTMTEDGDVPDDRDTKRMRITPPPSNVEPAGRRRSREEELGTDNVISDEREEAARDFKKMRVTP